MSAARAFIVTGASRGLGAALADRLRSAGEHVISVQRVAATALAGKEPSRRADLMPCDLSDLAEVEGLVARLRREVAPKFRSIVLISNAGVIGPIRQIGQLSDAAAVAEHVTINYMAPVLLVDGLVRTLGADGRLEVVNISSGAAERPIPGWSLYCSSKKAFKTFLDVLDVENDRVTVTHVDPGVMDTDMQGAIRGADARDFPGVSQFREFQADGRLRSASDVARSILEGYLDS